MMKETLGVPMLNELYVYVTNRCNCACRHCWIIPAEQSNRRQDKTHFIDSQLLDRAIREALPLGLKALKWTGGEPTIHPDFDQLLQVQKEHRLAGRMETNGMAVTLALAELMQDCGVSEVSVSLDGASAATHDHNRNVIGGFDRTLVGIRALVEAGYQPELILSLLHSNLGEIEDFLSLASELGAGSIKFNVVQPSLRGADLYADGGVPSVRQILEIQKKVLEEWPQRYGLPIMLDVPMAFRPLHEMFAENGLSRCGIFNILGLLANGHYALCGVGENETELVFGPAGCGQIKNIWNDHVQLKRLRAELPGGLRGICGRCLMRGACLGSCVATNYEHSRDLLAGYWFCEEAEKEGLFPTCRLSF
jgi:SynChlorMet cassette radical SAM/SPASM protein ScmF